MRETETKVEKAKEKLEKIQRKVEKRQEKEEKLRNIYDQCYKIYYDGVEQSPISTTNLTNKRTLENEHKPPDQRNHVCLPDTLNEI